MKTSSEKKETPLQKMIELSRIKMMKEVTDETQITEIIKNRKKSGYLKKKAGRQLK